MLVEEIFAIPFERCSYVSLAFAPGFHFVVDILSEETIECIQRVIRFLYFGEVHVFVKKDRCMPKKASNLHNRTAQLPGGVYALAKERKLCRREVIYVGVCD